MYLRSLSNTWSLFPWLSYVQVRCFRQSTRVSFHDDGGDKNKGSYSSIVNQRAKEFMENLDDENLKRKKFIESLLEEWRMEGKWMPSEITTAQWWELLHLRQSRTGYYKYLCLLHRKENHREEREQTILENARLLEENEALHDHLYHLSPIRDKHIYKWKKLNAMKSEIPIIVDLDYNDLHAKELKKSVEGILRALRSNSLHPEPLSIHLTSYRNNIRMTDYKNSESIFLGCHFHEQHFLDLYPSKQLVYLSSYGKPLVDFDTNCTYIVGGVEDFKTRPRLSFAKARSLGIRCASFPVKSYVALNVDRDLPIYTAIDIVRSMYFYHSWTKAFLDSLDSSKVKAFHPSKIMELNLKKIISSNKW